MPLTHVGTIPLETERLQLRRFALDDAADMFHNWAHDAEVTKYLVWQPHANLDATKEILAAWTKDYEAPDKYLWAIVLKETNQVIGSIGLKPNDTLQRAEIGYCIGRAFWNKGIMTEALIRVLDFGFTTLGLTRMQACHHTANPQSGKVMLKAGMQYEGCLKKWSFNNRGALVDCEMYAAVKQ
ncbi:MAG: GNAT family N-acetyltransferase [Clostridia bacterium]